jgi:hypothetical protein
MKNMKDKIDELATNSKDKNIRDLYRGSNLAKDENDDLLAASHNI